MARFSLEKQVLEVVRKRGNDSKGEKDFHLLFSDFLLIFQLKMERDNRRFRSGGGKWRL